MIPRRIAALVAAAAVLGMAATAAAHVEVTSTNRATGGVSITVPNESATADVVSVSVRVPSNAIRVTFPKVAGWRSTGRTVPLDPPLVIDGATVTSRVSEVTWTGGRIPPSGEASFPLTVRVVAGTQRAGLAFPAVQRYSDGSVQRWIGPPGSDAPAGVLAAPLPVVAATTAATPTEAATTAPSGTPVTITRADSGGSSTALILAVVAAAVVIGGIAALVLVRRRRTPRA